MKITYISNEYSSSISCLNDSELSGYILSKDEQRYFDTIYEDTLSYLSSKSLVAAIKAGSTLYTQDKLNKIYVNKNNAFGYTNDDINALKNFMNTSMVGNEIINFEDFI